MTSKTIADLIGVERHVLYHLIEYRCNACPNVGCPKECELLTYRKILKLD